MIDKNSMHCNSSFDILHRNSQVISTRLSGSAWYYKLDDKSLQYGMR
jgi:hypothetical protein